MSCQCCAEDGHVRLVGGSTELEGRLELCRNGVWGTLCDNFWDGFDSSVACRQLGFSSEGRHIAVSTVNNENYFKASRFYYDAHFGQGSGPVQLDQIRCRGDEMMLADCPSVDGRSCSHSNDVGIGCQPGKFAVSLKEGTKECCLLQEVLAIYPWKPMSQPHLC